MAKASKNYTVPKYVLKHIDSNIARLERTQKERQQRIESLRKMRDKLTRMDKHDDDNPVE